MGNQYRVSPDSHLTTRSLCDIYLIVSCHFGQHKFSRSHRGPLTPSDIFSAFTGGYAVKPGFHAFHLRGVFIPYLLCSTHFIFHFHLTLWNSIGLRPIPKPTRFNTKHSAKSVPCTHSHVMWCYRTLMQCNLCHYTQTHDQCMKTSTWTFYTVHCVCYEHSCLMHTTFHIFNIHVVMLIFHIFKSVHHISMHYIFSIIQFIHVNTSFKHVLK